MSWKTIIFGSTFSCRSVTQWKSRKYNSLLLLLWLCTDGISLAPLKPLHPPPKKLNSLIRILTFRSYKLTLQIPPDNCRSVSPGQKCFYCHQTAEEISEAIIPKTALTSRACIHPSIHSLQTSSVGPFKVGVSAASDGLRLVPENCADPHE